PASHPTARCASSCMRCRSYRPLEGVAHRKARRASVAIARASVDHFSAELFFENLSRLLFDRSPHAGVAGREVGADDGFFVGGHAEVAAVPAGAQLDLAGVKAHAAAEARAL